MTGLVLSLGPSVALMAVSWAILWTIDSYWNPLAFFGLWTGATMTMRALAGSPVFPLRRHVLLMALSVPLWWWFELVNDFVRNWHYTGAERYSNLEYALFASLAFSTVIPALDAAWGLTLRGVRAATYRLASHAWAWTEIGVGLVAQAAVFLIPRFAFPLVWIAPWLILDGLVALRGGANLAFELAQGRWAVAFRLALAGLLCGFLWEFWNFWSAPKWFYTVAFVDWLHVFEMPLLGYGGYVPFVWSAYQLVTLATSLVRIRRRMMDEPVAV
jgi:hypothetical protein